MCQSLLLMEILALGSITQIGLQIGRAATTKPQGGFNSIVFGTCSVRNHYPPCEHFMKWDSAKSTPPDMQIFPFRN